MEGADTYVASLEAALEAKRAQIESSVLPAMREHFKLLLTTFEGPYNILVKKGLIREDPYKLEDRLSEVRLPSRERFSPSEASEQMGIRLSQYHNQLEFIINYYEFSTAFLTLPRLKQLASLVKYLDFGNLADTSPSAPTAGLSVLVERVTRGTDSIAVGIIKDSLGQLGDLTRRLLRGVAETVLHQRERSKLELRGLGDGAVAAEVARVAADRTAALAVYRKAAQGAGMQFYQDLAMEVLEEDHPADAAAGAKLRDKVLARLKVEQPKEAKPKPTGPSSREILLDGLRLLAGCDSALRSALKTIRDSEELVGRKPLTMGERIRRFFARAAGTPQEHDKSYEIEYLEDSRGTPRVERLPYAAFLAESARTARTLQGLANRSGPAYQKVLAATDEQVFDLITRLAAEVYRIARRLEGLSAYFRSQVSPMHRGQFHGVHGDLAIIRNVMGKANKQKHEYVARQEEEEQFRKLGIAPPQ